MHCICLSGNESTAAPSGFYGFDHFTCPQNHDLILNKGLRLESQFLQDSSAFNLQHDYFFLDVWCVFFIS